jgi:hypothetical protein
VGLVGLVREQVDRARVELRAQRGQLVVVELMIDRKCLQRGLVDRAALFGVVEEGLDRGRKSRRAQGRSTPSIGLRARRGWRYGRHIDYNVRRRPVFPYTEVRIRPFSGWCRGNTLKPTDPREGACI